MAVSTSAPLAACGALSLPVVSSVQAVGVLSSLCRGCMTMSLSLWTR